MGDGTQIRQDIARPVSRIAGEVPIYHTDAISQIFAISIDFRTSPLPVRERAVRRAVDADQLLRYFVGHMQIASALVLSTCHRTELYVQVQHSMLDLDACVQRVNEFAEAFIPYPEDRAFAQTFLGEAAVRHLFRVTAGLESLAIGETQILGQAKAAHEHMRTLRCLHGALDYVVRQAISTGKAVRTDTHLGARTPSMSAMAVDYLDTKLPSGPFAVAVIGAGTMGRLAVDALTERGAGVYCSSRTTERAELLAGRVEGTVVSRHQLMTEYAPQFQAVISATSSTDYVFSWSDIELMQEHRHFAPLTIIDLAVPRDVDPEVSTIRNVTLIDVDILASCTEGFGALNAATLNDANNIVDRAVQTTIAHLEEQSHATPLIAALTARAESIRIEEVQRTLRQLQTEIPDIERRIDLLTKSMIKKLLHGPITYLKEHPEDFESVSLMQTLFQLGEEPTEIENALVDMIGSRRA